MIWKSLISQLPIGWEIKWTASISDGVLFNWQTLTDCETLFTSKGNYDDINKVKLETYDAPQVDGGWVLSYHINWKSIELNLIMRYDTEAELNAWIDNLKQRLAVAEWELEIEVNWEIRVAIVSLTWLTFNRDFKSKTIQSDIQINFEAMNHFYSKNQDSRTFFMTGDYNIDIWYTGTVYSFYKMYLVFNAWTSWITNIDIVKNWYTFSISEEITEWDILIIDGIEKTVTLNWNFVDYEGIFQRLDVWNNPFTINFNSWANVVCTNTLIYNKKRL